MVKANAYNNIYRVYWCKGRALLLGMLIASGCLFSCQPLAVYEKNTPIANGAWKSAVAATGSFDIKDTTALYKTYLVLRHTDTYQYENIWLNIGLQAPGDTMRFVRYNLSLTNGSAGWEGTGMNDIWELRKWLQIGDGRFKKTGTWNFAIYHLMRNDPLPAVLSAGLRVEKQP
jgi:gliding motility-associated lipoprotein GldH